MLWPSTPITIWALVVDGSWPRATSLAVNPKTIATTAKMFPVTCRRIRNLSRRNLHS